MQKSSKGRLSAAQIGEGEEVGRRVSRFKGSPAYGRQQFGGVAHRRDQDSERLSGRATRALVDGQPARATRRQKPSAK
jgi:hypothetical protein